MSFVGFVVVVGFVEKVQELIWRVCPESCLWRFREDIEKATKTTKATQLKEKPTNLGHGPTKATNSSG